MSKRSLLGRALCALGLLPLAGAALAADGRIPIVKPNAGWPFVINTPGSYYLTEDLFEAAATEFIHIDADNVTIDLEGHAIRTSGTSLSLVKTISDRNQIRITNGFLVKGGTGVQFNRGAGLGNYVLDHLRCMDQNVSGFSILGGGTAKMTAIVEHNLISGNFSPATKGIELQLGNDCHINDNVITGYADAIFMDHCEKNSIQYNNLSENGAGLRVANSGGTLSSNNNASYNVISGCVAGDGIFLDGNNSTVSFNTVSKNSTVGIRMKGDNSTIANNTASENVTGIFLADSSNCSLQNNTTSHNAGGAGPGSGVGIYLDPLSFYNSLDWNVSAANAACGIEIAAGAAGNVLSNNRTPGHPAACTACEPVIPACAGPCGAPPCGGACARAIVGILNAGAGSVVCGNLP